MEGILEEIPIKILKDCFWGAVQEDWKILL